MTRTADGAVLQRSAIAGATRTSLLVALLGLLALAPSRASGQGLAEPCVYTRDGQMVITDDAGDPHCAHLLREPAPVTTFRPPGRLHMSLDVAEMLSLAHDTAVRNQVDHRLVESLVEMESGFDPRAVSAKGAMGLMQLMPEVAREYGLRQPFDPWGNLEVGVRYLRTLLLRYGGDLPSALAAYNAGPGAVDRYGGVPPYAETRAYVKRVLYRYRQRVEGVALH